MISGGDRSDFVVDLSGGLAESIVHLGAHLVMWGACLLAERE
jgi:hypothetical protein